jgi:hypothetical protein
MDSCIPTLGQPRDVRAWGELSIALDARLAGLFIRGCVAMCT